LQFSRITIKEHVAGIPCSGIVGGPLPRDLFFVDFIYLENVRNLCFHDLSWFSGTNGMVPELFQKKSLKAYT